MSEKDLTIEEQQLIIRALAAIEGFLVNVNDNVEGSTREFAAIKLSAKKACLLLRDDMEKLRQTFQRLDKEKYG